MAFNVTNAVQVPLELFGGLVTEPTPIALPLGVSPDCQDLAFKPGSVLSRPGLTKVFATPFGSVTVTYAKSYVDNSGNVKNLFLDSHGNLYMEDVTNTPGTYGMIGTVTPGSYAKSITAFGREYIAISDGFSGTDVALQYDGTNLDRVTTDGPGTSATVENFIIPGVATTGASPLSLQRISNVVTVHTAVPHGLKIGYQAQLTKFTAQAIGFVQTITINNEDAPGIASVEMNTPHGLAPNSFVTIQLVSSVTVGGLITAVSRQGQVVTVTTTTAHGLVPGVNVTLVGVGTASFNTTAVVTAIPSPATFCFSQADVDATSSGGNAQLNWPIPDSGLPNYYEVIACPTTTNFQVNLQYADGIWVTGAVFMPWDGTFFVQTIPSTTSFTYQQNGQDGSSMDVGLVTPFGQISPGLHQMQTIYLTRQGYVTEPSPPVLFTANGGQYLKITKIPIGPPNVIARILAFTGAGGAYFFYIPVPAINNGQVVSTATQIQDNTTTGPVILDFSDNTLFASLGISIPGNNLAAQITIDSALGFAAYGDRLCTYGQRNCVNNLLNMSFDGGIIGTQITGWAGTGTLVAGHFSVAVQNPSLTQSFYQDAYGGPIGLPNTLYRARAWMSGGGCTVTISSTLGGFSISASLSPGVGGWDEADFGGRTPDAIPSDTIISISGGFGTVDHLSIIFAEEPFRNNTLFGSYVNNPEAFDGVSGVFGVEDARKIMSVGIIRGSMNVLTQDPAGRLHVIQNNGVTEPAGWASNEVAANCGALSTFAMTVSQADDATAGGGEEWMAWASYSGARIFGGDQPWKISQEIQPTWSLINSATFLTAWALNDPVVRRIYFGVPLGDLEPGVCASAPNKILVVDYKQLDSASQIAEAAPVHVTLSGKLIARDHARKWCPWNVKTNGAAQIYREAGGPLFTVFYAGNGFPPNAVAGGCGNVFALCDQKLTDDCAGQIHPYYITAAFTNAEVEQALQLGGQRKLLKYLQWQVSGTGKWTVTPLIDSLNNPWPITATLPLRADPFYDDEWGGGQASGQRFFLKFTVNPS